MTAILVLYGLPWLLTGSILAHETMHAWLRLSGVSHLPADVEEGLAQLMALLWLEHQAPDPVRSWRGQCWADPSTCQMPEWSAVLLHVMRTSNFNIGYVSLLLVCLLSCSRLHNCSSPEGLLACRAATRSDWPATLLSRCGPSTRSSLRAVIVLSTEQLGS